MLANFQLDQTGHISVDDHQIQLQFIEILSNKRYHIKKDEQKSKDKRKLMSLFLWEKLGTQVTFSHEMDVPNKWH